MRRKTRTKVKKWTLISGISLSIILLIGLGIFAIIKLTHKEEISYDDGIVGKNYFSQIDINLENKKVRRDGQATSLTKEFDISEEAATLALSSEEELRNLFSNSVFEISKQDQIITLTNKYQTKKIIIQASEVKEKVEGEEITQIQEGLYIASFYSEKLTKAMYNYYKEQDYIKNVFYDEIIKTEEINEESQTMYRANTS